MTLKEDYVKIKNKNQGQILSLMRTVAIKIIGKTESFYYFLITSDCLTQPQLL